MDWTFDCSPSFSLVLDGFLGNGRRLTNEILADYEENRVFILRLKLTSTFPNGMLVVL